VPMVQIRRRESLGKVPSPSEFVANRNMACSPRPRRKTILGGVLAQLYASEHDKFAAHLYRSRSQLANVPERAGSKSSDVASRRFMLPRVWASEATFANGRIFCGLANSGVVRGGCHTDFLRSLLRLQGSISIRNPDTHGRRYYGVIPPECFFVTRNG
jgi:hypothetical protein